MISVKWEYELFKTTAAFSIKKRLFYKNFSVFLNLLIFLIFSCHLSSIFVFFFKFCSSKVRQCSVFFFNWDRRLSNVLTLQRLHYKNFVWVVRSLEPVLISTNGGMFFVDFELTPRAFSSFSLDEAFWGDLKNYKCYELEILTKGNIR